MVRDQDTFNKWKEVMKRKAYKQNLKKLIS